MSAATPRLDAYRATLAAPLRQRSLCFLVRKGQLLLALKKRGFGAGKWNGPGGKLEPGETIEQTAVRETEEEVGMTPIAPRRVATVRFYFPDVPTERDWNQEVCVFMAHEWRGEPAESEEMAPRWFQSNALPFDEMWNDDRIWLPRVLAGARLSGEFLYAADLRVAEYELREEP